MWFISFVVSFYLVGLCALVGSVEFRQSGSFGRLRGGSASAWARGPATTTTYRGRDDAALMNRLQSRRDRGSRLRHGFLRAEADGDASPRNHAADVDNIESIEHMLAAIDRVMAEHPTPSPRRDDLLQGILRDIKFSPSVLKPFIHWDSSKPYTRNRIKFLSGKYELLVLCWNPGMGSKIHDHPGDGCYVRMLQGRLLESTYKITDATTNTMELVRSTEVKDGDVTYINDGMGVHRLANPDASIGAVSLHLYTPPTLKCTVWDESSSNTDAVTYTPQEVTMRCTTDNGKPC